MPFIQGEHCWKNIVQYRRWQLWGIEILERQQMYKVAMNENDEWNFKKCSDYTTKNGEMFKQKWHWPSHSLHDWGHQHNHWLYLKVFLFHINFSLTGQRRSLGQQFKENLPTYPHKLLHSSCRVFLPMGVWSDWTKRFTAIDVDSGKSILFVPKLAESYTTWMGKWVKQVFKEPCAQCAVIISCCQSSTLGLEGRTEVNLPVKPMTPNQQIVENVHVRSFHFNFHKSFTKDRNLFLMWN